jgi:hypothetical protein
VAFRRLHGAGGGSAQPDHVRMPPSRKMTAVGLVATVAVIGLVGVSAHQKPVAAASHDTCGYPTGKGRSATVFAESTVTRRAQVFGTGLASTIGVFATDEWSLMLGLTDANGTASPWAPTSPKLTYGHVHNPSLGDLAATKSTVAEVFHGSAPSRPIFPALFISPVPAGTAASVPQPGDWQQASGNGSPNTNVSDVFGTWMTASIVKGKYVRGKVPTASNISSGKWVLGPGADTPSPSWKTLGFDRFTSEVRWNVAEVHDYLGHPLNNGSYKMQVMTHDGDSNTTGGDVGEYCVVLNINGITSPSTSTSTTSTTRPATTTTTLPKPATTTTLPKPTTTTTLPKPTTTTLPKPTTTTAPKTTTTVTFEP